MTHGDYAFVELAAGGVALRNTVVRVQDVQSRVNGHPDCYATATGSTMPSAGTLRRRDRSAIGLARHGRTTSSLTSTGKESSRSRSGTPSRSATSSLRSTASGRIKSGSSSRVGRASTSWSLQSCSARWCPPPNYPPS